MKKIIALAVAAAVAAPAMADLTIGASARYQMDNGTYTAATTTAAASTSDTAASTNRVLVSFSGSTTAESGLFVSTAATLQLAGAATSTDGDNAITIGNDMANVVLGYFEPAGVFSSGADQFQNGAFNAGYEGSLRTREANNIGVNVTAVDNLTFQVSTNVDSQDNIRTVVGYDFGAFAVKAGLDSYDGAKNGTSLSVSTELAGVALAASMGERGAAKSTNINASYMGFGIALQNDETSSTAKEKEIYGSYSVANAGGVEGFTVTVGAGDSDATGVDTRYGVRLDYAF